MMADAQTTATSLHAHDCPAAWTDHPSGTLLAQLENSVTSMTSLTATMREMKSALQPLRDGSQSEHLTGSQLAANLSDGATAAQIDLVIQDLTQSKASITQADSRLSANPSACPSGCSYAKGSSSSV